MKVDKNKILVKYMAILLVTMSIWIVPVLLFCDSALIIMGLATLFANITWMLGFWYGCDKDQITLYIVTFGVAPTRLIIYGLASYVSLVDFDITPTSLGIIWTITWMIFAIPKFSLMIELGKLRWSDHYKKLIGEMPWNENS